MMRTLAILSITASWLALPAPATATPAAGSPPGTNSDRATSDRAASDRAAADRTAPDRAAADRTASDRTASDRTASNRAATERAATERGERRDAPGAATGSAHGDLELAGSVVPLGGPAISAVLSAAYATAGFDRDPSRSWIRRARLGGLVPWLTLRTTRDTSWQDNQPEVGHGSTLEARATWRLDRLLFDGRELQVAAIEAARRRERRRLANRVIRSYFTWRRAAEATRSTGDERVATRMAEAAAELDALTDGWFSDELSRGPRGTSRGGARAASP
jgi:hypothetical protein